MSKRIVLSRGKKEEPPKERSVQDVFNQAMRETIDKYSQSPSYPGQKMRSSFYAWTWGHIEVDALTQTWNELGGNATRDEVDRALYEWRRQNRGFG